MDLRLNPPITSMRNPSSSDVPKRLLGSLFHTALQPPPPVVEPEAPAEGEGVFVVPAVGLIGVIGVVGFIAGRETCAETQALATPALFASPL